MCDVNTSYVEVRLTSILYRGQNYCITLIPVINTFAERILDVLVVGLFEM